MSAPTLGEHKMQLDLLLALDRHPPRRMSVGGPSWERFNERKPMLRSRTSGRSQPVDLF